MKRYTTWLGLLALLLLTECQCGRQEHELLSIVETGSADRVKEALAAGEPVNEKDEYGNTALHLVAQAGEREIAQLLIDKAADVNAKTIYGHTPLHRAASKEVAELLISKGADVNVTDSFASMAPLHWAVSYGNREVAEALLEGKANIEAKDKHGSTPLHLTASNGRKEAGEFLLEKGAKVNAIDEAKQAPLHYAARSGQAEMVYLLIAKGADRNAKDESGKTPEDLACGDAAKDAFRFGGIAKAIATGDTEKVSALIEKMTNVNAAGLGGTTLLHVAAREGRGKVIELLIEKKANVNAMDSEEKTPLDVAKDKAAKAVLQKHEAKTGKEIKEEEEKEKAEKEAEKK